MYEDILNLPEETGRLGTMVAISDLIHETERLEAARAAKEAELLELRAQTAELFGSALEGEGRDEEAVRAAMAAWLRDPETAAQAIAGCSIEEAVSAAGCNQYKHKPGCPDADSSEDSEDRSWADKSNYTKLKSTIETAKKARERYNESPSQENSAFLSTATARVKKYAESLIAENKKIFDRLYKEGMSKQDDYELGERRPYGVLIDGERSYANFIGAANYLKDNANGERAEEALRDIETSAKELADLDAELTKILKSHNKKDDEANAAHEPSLEDMLVGDLVQAAGCNQYKHKPGCPEAEEGDNAKKKEKQAPSRIKSDSDGGANLLILPTGDVHQVSDNDLKHYKYNTKFSAFHVNKDGTYAGTPEDGLMLGATLDEALNRFPALSDAAKKDVTSFFAENSKNGSLRFYRLKFN